MFRILLRFDKLQTVLADIKKVYKQQLHGGTGLTIFGLQEALTMLHTPLAK